MTTRKRAKRILFISDMHTLSNVGLMSEQIILHAEDEKKRNIVLPNEVQKILLSEWNQMCDVVGMVDIVVNVGDSGDGPNPKAQGYGVVSTNTMLQGKEAASLIRRIKYKKYAGVNGSNYHVGNNPSIDAYVADLLHSSRKPSVFGTDLLLSVNGVNIHVSHKVGASSSIHRATGVNKELYMAVLNSRAFGDIDVIVRGHTHYYTHVSPFIDGKVRHGFIVPCWKARDEYSRSGSLAWCPVNGYVVMDVEANGKYAIEPHCFQLESESLFQKVTL